MKERGDGQWLVAVDLEATCCDRQTIPRDEMETIEIGAVALDSRYLEIESEFQSFVKPVRHPVLTDFCTSLTSIRQEDVDQSDEFPLVARAFSEWLHRFPDHVFCSWGDYDRKQIEQDCRFHEVPYPMSLEHRNVKKEFSRYLGTSTRFGIGGALRRLGIERTGIAHRAIDDVHNIARILCHMSSE